MPRASWRLAAPLAVAALVAGCSGGDAGEAGTVITSPTPTERPGNAEPADRLDGQLTIGTVLPETGQAAFLGEPQIQGVRLAVADINDARGVLGQPVRLVEGDSGTAPDSALRTVDRLHRAGVDAVVGAATSAVSEAIIPSLSEQSTVQCSASNTSPQLLPSVDAPFYFRTVSDDEAAAPVIGQRVIDSGADRVVIVARADAYGIGLADPLRRVLEDADVDVVPTLSYDPETAGFGTEIDEVTGEDPDAVVVIGYAEAGQLVRRLVEAGIDPERIFGSDGLFSPDLPVLVGADPGFIDGLTVVGASGDREFNARRLNPALSGKGNFIYGAQAYDCVVVIALAVLAAQSDDPAVFAARIADVTRGGTRCVSFRECRDFLEQDQDIDYDGPSGPIDLIPGLGGSLGSPGTARYAVATFMEQGQLVQVDARDQTVDPDR